MDLRLGMPRESCSRTARWCCRGRRRRLPQARLVISVLAVSAQTTWAALRPGRRRHALLVLVEIALDHLGLSYLRTDHLGFVDLRGVLAQKGPLIIVPRRDLLQILDQFPAELLVVVSAGRVESA